MKFWWPYNGTVIATVPAYELTGNRKYLSRSSNGHSLIAPILDKANGTAFCTVMKVSVPLKGNILTGLFRIPGMYFRGLEDM